MFSVSLPTTPEMSMDTSASRKTQRDVESGYTTLSGATQEPSSLCRWSIHLPDMNYKGIQSPPQHPVHDFDLEDEETWPRWDGTHKSENAIVKLSDGLENNGFSNVRPDDLPIAVSHIARAAKRSPIELQVEALGFSIMSRNVDLVEDLAEKCSGSIDSSGLYPFHLAVSYLDGSRTCCNVLGSLLSTCPRSLRKLDVNDLGHTILDNLMISIIKAHTSCSPDVVDVIFKKDRLFAGEEVNVCGRWDADSSCIRTLFANGMSAIPFNWKHMFCHTSVQTICHCIWMIYGLPGAPDINKPSGLFVKRCLYCGLKMELFPIHTLVLVGYHLSRSGCAGETLFGILACLLCLLSNDADPLLKADISVQALLGIEELDGCSHEELDPTELAEAIPAELIMTWSTELRTGWHVICKVLRHSRAVWNLAEYSQSEMEIDDNASSDTNFTEECPTGESHEGNYFKESRILGSLWAATQTELLTYRRLEEGDPWISKNFSMDALNKSLDKGDQLLINLMQKHMMRPHCACGLFLKESLDMSVTLPCVDEAAAYYFSNLEDWKRTTYLHMPDILEYCG